MRRTAYPDLDAVLAELVAGAQAVLGEDFHGAYLHGSFATGDADEFSDVDFVIVVRGELTDRQQDGLQSLHRRLYGLDTPWAQHLEGSYIPEGALRRMDWSHRPFLFLDNGASELVRDAHCNTAVVRRVLRERGLVLAGPAPATIIEPVTAADLRREALARVQEYADWAYEGPMSAWKQPYLVLTLCRLLFTLVTGRVGAKGEAGTWAVGALDSEWADLIGRAIADRADPWERAGRPADPGLEARTVEFATYAVAEAARRSVSTRGRPTRATRAPGPP